MRLSLKLISEQLTSDCTFSSLTSPVDPPVLYSFPVLYQPGMEFQPGGLYVVDGEELPDRLWLRGSVGLIVRGDVPEAYVFQGCSVLCVERSVPKASLFAMVSGIFWKYQKWETKLHKLLATHTSLQAFLEITYPLVIRSSLFVCGKNGRVLAHLEEDGNGGFDTSTAFDGTPAPMDQLFPNNDFLAKWLSGEKAFESPTWAQGNEWPCYYRRLLNERGEPLGFLLLVSHGDAFRESDKQVVSYLGDILEFSLDRMFELQGRQMWEGSYLFKDMLEDAPISHGEFTHRLHAQGLANHRFCCVRLILKQTALGVPVETICWHINSGMKDIFATAYDSSVVLFIRLSPDAYFLRELPEQVVSLIQSGNFCAGVSHTFSAVRDTKHYYIQACKALELGARHDPDNYCYFFSDYALRYILNQSPSAQPARTLCMEEIKMLQDMDRDNDSEYCRTLKVYFESGMNLQKTANELYIHRSTLTYRLNRIRNEAGLDLDNYKSRLYAMLSLELLEL